MNLQIQNAFQTALKVPNSAEELRSVVENLAMDGHETTDLLAELEWLRTQLREEEEEDQVLDVMDFLTGWCSPHLHIQMPEKTVIATGVNIKTKGEGQCQFIRSSKRSFVILMAKLRFGLMVIIYSNRDYPL